jgi:streptogramin lyase
VKTLLSRALVALALFAYAPRATALVGPPVVVSPIAPGDVIFTEFFDGWHKLNPATGVVTPLPWPESTASADRLAFDVDGALLFNNRGGELQRLNPVTGFVSSVPLPGNIAPVDFAVASTGDLLLAESGGVSLFSRATNTVVPITSDQFFAPRNIARGQNGRTFITEFFDDLWEINAASGGRTSIDPSIALSIPSLIAVRSDGDLIVKNFSPSVLYRIAPNTGAVTLFSEDLPSAVRDMALDASNNLWLSSNGGIFRYDAAGGPGTLIAEYSFFSPQAITIVPQGWKPPPVPEPSAAVLAALAATGLGIPRRRRVGT